MGFMDKFKRKSGDVDRTVQNDTPQVNREPNFSFTTLPTEDGSLCVEMINYGYNKGKFYDTVRLIVTNSPVTIAGKRVEQCYVSWYGQSDCVMFGRNGEEGGRRSDYSSVLAQINVEALLNNEAYRVMVLDSLFDQKRVERYLSEGLKDNPETPCGNYIGGVGIVKGQYRKYFSPEIGSEAHMLPELVNARQKIASQKEAARQAEIASLQSKLAKLQNEGHNGFDR